MKASLRPGVSRTNRIVVDPARTISFMGEEGRVYATHLVRSRYRAHLPRSDPGAHRSRRGLGRHRSRDQAERSDPSRHDGRDHGDGDGGRGPKVEPIGGGTHARFVVDVAKTLERVNAKVAKHRAR